LPDFLDDDIIPERGGGKCEEGREMKWLLAFGIVAQGMFNAFASELASAVTIDNFSAGAIEVLGGPEVFHPWGEAVEDLDIFQMDLPESQTIGGMRHVRLGHLEFEASDKGVAILSVSSEDGGALSYSSDFPADSIQIEYGTAIRHRGFRGEELNLDLSADGLRAIVEFQSVNFPEGTTFPTGIEPSIRLAVGTIDATSPTGAVGSSLMVPLPVGNEAFSLDFDLSHLTGNANMADIDGLEFQTHIPANSSLTISAIHVVPEPGCLGLFCFGVTAMLTTMIRWRSKIAR
jgi:hypothetical protein